MKRWLIRDSDGVNCARAPSRKALLKLGYTRDQVAAAEPVRDAPGKAWAGTSAEQDHDTRTAAERWRDALPEGAFDLIVEAVLTKLKEV